MENKEVGIGNGLREKVLNPFRYRGRLTLGRELENRRLFKGVIKGDRMKK